MPCDVAELIDVLKILKQHHVYDVPLSQEVWQFLNQANTERQIISPKEVIPDYFEKKEGPHFDNKEDHWADLKQRVLNNPDLLKHVRPGKQLVFGVGNLNADLFFCGEAPGADEETQGIPFVGRAGQLLTKIIQAMGLAREKVYIGNIMNWRPEMDTPFGNRPPTQEEMQFCLPYLIEQVQIVKPKAIIALGATAVNGLLGYDKSRKMSEVRGTWKEFCGIPLMITFHPSYLLRNNTNAVKRLVWEDMLKVMDRVGMEISEKQKGYFL